MKPPRKRRPTRLHTKRARVVPLASDRCLVELLRAQRHALAVDSSRYANVVCHTSKQQ